MGRRLVLTLAIVLLFIFTPGHAVAEQISVTATVPVSDLWAEAIADNSRIFLEPSYTKEQDLYYTVWLRGLNYEVLRNHKVKMEIFLDDILVSSKTDESDPHIFSLIFEKEGQYRLVFTDITWDRHVKLKEEVLIDQSRINVLKVLATLFQFNRKYTDVSVPGIINSPFF